MRGWAVLLCLVLALPAQGASPRIMLIRDAETETMLRNFANPLFRASGVDPNLVRIVLIRDNAINSFVSTGNLLFVHTGLIMKAESAPQEKPVASATPMTVNKRFPLALPTVSLALAFAPFPLVRAINAPLMILHGARDAIVPATEGKALFDRAREPKKIVIFPNGQHTDLDNFGAVEEVAKWLATIQSER